MAHRLHDENEDSHQEPQGVLDVCEGLPQRPALIGADLLVGRELSTALAGAGQPPAQAGEEGVYVLALGLAGEKAPGVRIADVADELAGQVQGGGLLEHHRLSRHGLQAAASPSAWWLIRLR